MPLFEYICQDCAHRFETIVSGSTRAECPSCQSIKLEKQFSPFGVGTAPASAPSAVSGPCGSCGDPRGPGACSRN